MTTLTEAERRRLDALRRWATLLDAAFRIPGTSFRLGLDALIGLVPGAGDAVAGVLSAGVILQAFRLGLPRVVLARMVFNVVLEVIAGAIPFLGDLFDIAWKANLRNVALLERFVLLGQRSPSRGDYVFVGVLLAVLAAAILVPVISLAALLYFLQRPLV